MSDAKLRIAFVGRFHWHNGSSHALLGYARAGQRLNYDVRVSALGIFDEVVEQHVPVAEPDWKPDVMVFVFEERFLRDDGFLRAERLVPRDRRLVIDPDGKYSEVVTIGSDSNHPNPELRQYWVSDFERLSDTILQPRLGNSSPGTRTFLYFGVDIHRHHPNGHSNPIYDIVYVGNNWYRWHDLVWFLGGLASVRSRLGRIAIFGRYWSGDALEGYEEATYSDPDFLRSLGAEVFPSVPFDAVEPTMRQGRVSPIFVRPILNELALVTPRMFETFAADTVPLLPPYMRHATMLYGDFVRPLILPEEQPGDAVLAILEDYEDRCALATEIRACLEQEHCYEVRLQQLLSFVPGF